jgi:geranylgeranylglycerol-phosphate geranylgeranyltransferase
MGNSIAVAVLRLSRIPSCIVAFLTVFIPTYAHTHDLRRALAVSAPIFLVSACTFILNDLNDVERDRINHPHRPLPLGAITPRTAAIAYLTIFVIALGLIHTLAEVSLHFLYLSIFLLAINYNTIVNHIAELKTAYVAGTITLALTLVCRIVGAELDWNLLASAFFFILGRELLMDVQDWKGDGPTIAKRFSPRAVTWLAFGLQCISALILLLIAQAALEAAAASIFSVLLFIVISEWWNEGQRRRLLQLMQFQMLAGIAFLV